MLKNLKGPFGGTTRGDLFETKKFEKKSHSVEKNQSGTLQSRPVVYLTLNGVNKRGTLWTNLDAFPVAFKGKGAD